MNLDQLTIEERAALNNLVKSPGWYVLLQHHIIPQLQGATQRMDRVQPHLEAEMQLYRGIRITYKDLLEQLYKVADLPNPFEQHALGLMTSLASYTTPPVDTDKSDYDLHYDNNAQKPLCGAKSEYTTLVREKVLCVACKNMLRQERPSRVSFPV